MPPAPPAACGSLCAGRAMLSPLEGLRTSAARTTSCSAGCVVALAALRPHCALGKWAGAMQQRRECQRLISDPARLACDSVAERAILSPIAAGVVDTDQIHRLWDEPGCTPPTPTILQRCRISVPQCGMVCNQPQRPGASQAQSKYGTTWLKRNRHYPLALVFLDEMERELIAGVETSV